MESSMDSLELERKRKLEAGKEKLTAFMKKKAKPKKTDELHQTEKAVKASQEERLFTSMSSLETALSSRDELIAKLTQSLEDSLGQGLPGAVQVVDQVPALLQVIDALQAQLQQADESLQEQFSLQESSTMALLAAKQQILQLNLIINSKDEELKSLMNEFSSGTKFLELTDRKEVPTNMKPQEACRYCDSYSVKIQLLEKELKDRIEEGSILLHSQQNILALTQEQSTSAEEHSEEICLSIQHQAATEDSYHQHPSQFSADVEVERLQLLESQLNNLRAEVTLPHLSDITTTTHHSSCLCSHCKSISTHVKVDVQTFPDLVDSVPEMARFERLSADKLKCEQIVQELEEKLREREEDCRRYTDSIASLQDELLAVKQVQQVGRLELTSQLEVLEGNLSALGLDKTRLLVRVEDLEHRLLEKNQQYQDSVQHLEAQKELEGKHYVEKITSLQDELLSAQRVHQVELQEKEYQSEKMEEQIEFLSRERTSLLQRVRHLEQASISESQILERPLQQQTSGSVQQYSEKVDNLLDAHGDSMYLHKQESVITGASTNSEVLQKQIDALVGEQESWLQKMKALQDELHSIYECETVNKTRQVGEVSSESHRLMTNTESILKVLTSLTRTFELLKSSLPQGYHMEDSDASLVSQIVDNVNQERCKDFESAHSEPEKLICKSVEDQMFLLEFKDKVERQLSRAVKFHSKTEQLKLNISFMNVSEQFLETWEALQRTAAELTDSQAEFTNCVASFLNNMNSRNVDGGAIPSGTVSQNQTGVVKSSTGVECDHEELQAQLQKVIFDWQRLQVIVQEKEIEILGLQESLDELQRIFSSATKKHEQQRCILEAEIESLKRTRHQGQDTVNKELQFFVWDSQDFMVGVDQDQHLDRLRIESQRSDVADCITDTSLKVKSSGPLSSPDVAVASDNHVSFVENELNRTPWKSVSESNNKHYEEETSVTTRNLDKQNRDFDISLEASLYDTCHPDQLLSILMNRDSEISALKKDLLQFRMNIDNIIRAVTNKESEVETLEDDLLHKQATIDELIFNLAKVKQEAIFLQDLSVGQEPAMNSPDSFYVDKDSDSYIWGSNTPREEVDAELLQGLAVNKELEHESVKPDFSKRDSETDSLVNSVTSKSSITETLEASLAYGEASTEIQQHWAEVHSQMKLLKNSLLDRESEIDILNTRLTEKEAELQLMRRSNMEFEAHTIVLKENLVNKESQIKALSSSSDSGNTEITYLKGIIADKELEIEGWRNRLSIKETEMSNLDRCLGERQDEAVTLRTTVDNITAEMETLRIALENREDELRHLMSEAETVHSSLKTDALESKGNSSTLLQKNEVNIDDAQESVIEIDSGYRRTLNTFAHVQAEILDLKSRNALNESMVEELKSVVHERDLEIEHMKTIIVAGEGTHETEKDVLREKEAEILQLRKELLQAQSVNSQLETDVLSSRAEVNSLVPSLLDKSSEADNLKSNLQIKEVSLNEMFLDLSKCQSEVAALQDKLHELESEVLNLQNTASDKDSAIASLEKRLCKLQSLHGKQSEELSSLQQPLSEKVDESMDSRVCASERKIEICNLKQDLERKDTEIQELKGCIEEKVSEVTSLKMSIENAQLKVEQLQVELMDKEEQLSQHHQKEQILQAEVNTMLGQLKEKDNETEVKVGSLQEKMEECEIRCSVIQEAFIETSDELLAAKNSVSNKVFEVRAMTERLRAMEEKVLQNEQSVEEYRENVALLQQTLEEKDLLVASLKSQLSDAVCQLQVAANESKQELAAMESHLTEKEAVVDQLLLSQTESEGRVQTLHEVLKRNQEEMKVETSEVAKLKSEVEILTEKLKGSESIIEMLQSSGNKGSAEINSLHATVLQQSGEINSLNTKLSESSAFTETLQQEVQQANAVLALANENVALKESELCILSEDLIKTNNELSSLYLVLSNKDTELLSLKYSVHNKESARSILTESSRRAGDETRNQLRHAASPIEDSRDAVIHEMVEKLSVCHDERTKEEDEVRVLQDMLTGAYDQKDSQEVKNNEVCVELVSAELHVTKQESEIMILKDGLSEKEIEISLLQKTLLESDVKLSSLRDLLTQKDIEVSSLTEKVLEKDRDISCLMKQLLNKDIEISLVQKNLAEANSEASSMSKTILPADNTVCFSSEMLSEKDHDIVLLRETISEKDSETSLLKEQLCEKERTFSWTDRQSKNDNGVDLPQNLSESNQGSSSLKNTLLERDRLVSNTRGVTMVMNYETSTLKETLSEKDSEVSSLKEKLSEKDNEVSSLRKILSEKDIKVSSLSETSEKNSEASSGRKTLEIYTDVSSLRETFSGNNHEVNLLVETLSEKDHEIALLTKLLSGKDHEISSFMETLSGQEHEISSMMMTLSGKDLEISSLIETLSEKDHEISVLKGKLSEKEHETSILMGTLSEKDNETSILMGTLSEKSCEKSSLIDTVSGKVGEISSLTDVSSQKHSEVFSLRETLLEKEREISYFQEKIYEKDVETLCQDEKLSKCKAEISFLVEKLSGLNYDISSLKETLSEKNIEVTTSREILLAKDLELFSSKEEISDKDHEISSLNERVSGKDIEISSLRETLSEKELDNSSLTETLSEQEQEISYLKVTVSERDSLISSLTQKLSEREHELSSLIEALSDKGGEISSLTETLSRKEHEIASVVETLSGKEQDLASLTQMLSKKDHDLASLTETLSGNEYEISTLTETMSQRELALSSFTEALSQRDNELSYCKETLAEKDFEISSLRGTLSEQNKDVSSLKETLLEKDRAMSSLKEVLLENEKAMLSLKESLSKKETDVLSLKESLSKTDNHISSLNEALLEKDKDISSLKETFSEKETDILSLKESLSKTDSHISSLNEALLEKDKDISSLKETLSEKDNEMMYSRESIAHKEDEISTIKKTLMEKEDAVQDLSEKLSRDDDEISSLLEALSMKENVIASLKEQLSQLEKETQILRETLIQRDNDIFLLAETLSGRDHEISSLKDTLSKNLLEFSSMKETLSEKINLISSLEDKFLDKESEVLAWREDLSKKDNEMLALLEKLSEKESETALLTKKFSERESETTLLTVKLSEIESETTLLKKELSEKADEVVLLRGRLLEKDHEISSLGGTLTDKSHDVSSLKETVSLRDHEILSLSGLLVEKNLEISSLKETVSQKNYETFSLSATLAEKDREISILKDNVSQQECELSLKTDNLVLSMQEQLLERDTEISHLRETLAQMRESKADKRMLSDELSRTVLEVATLQTALTNAQEQLASSETSLDEQVLQVATLMGILGETGSRVESLQSILDTRNKEIKLLRSTTTQKEHELDHRISELVQNREILEKELHEAKESQISLTQENSTLELNIFTLEQQLKDILGSTERLKNENNRLKQELSYSKAEVENLCGTIQQNMNEILRLDRQNVGLEEESVFSTSSDLDKKDAAEEDLSTDNSSQENELKIARGTLAQSLKYLHQYFSATEVTLSKLTTMVSDLEADKDNLLEDLYASEKRSLLSEALLSSQAADLEEKCTALVQQETFLQEQALTMAELSNTLQEHTSKLQEQDRQLLELSQTIDEKIKKIHDQDIMLSELTERLQEKEAAFCQLLDESRTNSQQLHESPTVYSVINVSEASKGSIVPEMGHSATSQASTVSETVLSESNVEINNLTETKLSSLQAEHCRLLGLLSMFQEHIQEKEAVIVDQKLQIEEQQSQMNDLHLTLSRKTNDLKELDAGTAAFKVEHESLLDEKYNLEQKILKLLNELDGQEQTVTQLTIEEKRLHEKLAEMTHTVEVKEAALFDSKHDYEIMTKEVHELKQELEQKDVANMSLREQLELLHISAERSNNEKEVLKANFESCIEELQQRLGDQEIELKRLRSQLAEETKSICQGQEKIQEMYEHQISQMDEKLQGSEKLCEKLEKDLLESKAKMASAKEVYEQQLSDQELHLQSTTSELMRLKDNVSKILHNHQCEMAGLKRLQEIQTNELEENCVALERTVTELKKQLQEQTKKFVKDKNELEQNLEIQISDLEEKRRFSELEVSRLKKYMDEMKSDHEKDVQNIEKSYEARLYELEDKCCMTTNELEKLRKSMMRSVGNYSDEKEAMEIRVEELEALRRDLENRNAILEDDMAVLRNQALQREEEMKTVLTNAAQAQQERIAELTEEIKRLQQQLSSQQQLQSEEITKLKQSCEALNVDLQLKNIHLEEENSRLKQMIEEDVQQLDQTLFQGGDHKTNTEMADSSKLRVSKNLDNLEKLSSRKNWEASTQTSNGDVLSSQSSLFQEEIQPDNCIFEVGISSVEDTTLTEGFVAELSGVFSHSHEKASVTQKAHFYVEQCDGFQPEITLDESDYCNSHPIGEEPSSERFEPEMPDQFLIEAGEEMSSALIWQTEYSTDSSMPPGQSPGARGGYNTTDFSEIVKERERKKSWESSQTCDHSHSDWFVREAQWQGQETMQVRHGWEKQVNNMKEELEEKYVTKMREQEVRMKCEYDSKQASYKLEMEQRFDQQMKAVRYEWERKFNEALLKVKKDMEKRALQAAALELGFGLAPQNLSADTSDSSVISVSNQVHSLMEGVDSPQQLDNQSREDNGSEVMILCEGGGTTIKIEDMVESQEQSLSCAQDASSVLSELECVSPSSSSSTVVAVTSYTKITEEDGAVDSARSEVSETSSVPESLLEELEEISHESSQDLPLEWELTSPAIESGACQESAEHPSIWEVFDGRCVRQDCQELESLRVQYEHQIASLQRQLETQRHSNLDQMDDGQQDYCQLVEDLRLELDNSQRRKFDQVMDRVNSRHVAEIQNLQAHFQYDLYLEVTALKLSLEQIYLTRSQLEMADLKMRFDQRVEALNRQHQEEIRKLSAQIDVSDSLSASLTHQMEQIVLKISHELKEMDVTQQLTNGDPEQIDETQQETHSVLTLLQDLYKLLLNQHKEITSLRQKLSEDSEGLLRYNSEVMKPVLRTTANQNKAVSDENKEVDIIASGTQVDSDQNSVSGSWGHKLDTTTESVKTTSLSTFNALCQDVFDLQKHLFSDLKSSEAAKSELNNFMSNMQQSVGTVVSNWRRQLVSLPQQFTASQPKGSQLSETLSETDSITRQLMLESHRALAQQSSVGTDSDLVELDVHEENMSRKITGNTGDTMPFVVDTLEFVDSNINNNNGSSEFVDGDINNSSSSSFVDGNINNHNGGSSGSDLPQEENQVEKLRQQLEQLKQELSEAKDKEAELLSLMEEQEHSHQQYSECLRLELEHEKQMEIDTLESEYRVQLEIELKRHAAELSALMLVDDPAILTCPPETGRSLQAEDSSIQPRRLPEDGSFSSGEASLNGVESSSSQRSSTEVILKSELSSSQVNASTDMSDHVTSCQNSNNVSNGREQLALVNITTEVSTLKAINEQQKTHEQSLEDYEKKIKRLEQELEQTEALRASLDSSQETLKNLSQQLQEAQEKYNNLLEGIHNGKYENINQLLKDKYDEELDLARSLMQQDFDDSLHEEKKKLMEKHRTLMDQFMEDREMEETEMANKYSQEVEQVKQTLNEQFEKSLKKYQDEIQELTSCLHQLKNAQVEQSPEAARASDKTLPEIEEITFSFQEAELLKSESTDSNGSYDPANSIEFSADHLLQHESTIEQDNPQLLPTLQIRAFPETSAISSIGLEIPEYKLKIQQLVGQVEQLTLQVKEAERNNSLSTQSTLLLSVAGSQTEDDLEDTIRLQAELDRITTERENVAKTNEHLLQLLSNSVKTYMEIEGTINRKLNRVVSGGVNQAVDEEEARDSGLLGAAAGAGPEEEPDRPEAKPGHGPARSSPMLQTQMLGNISLLSTMTDEGLEISQLAETLFMGPGLDADGEEILTDAQNRLHGAVDQLLELLEQSASQLLEARVSQEQLLESLTSREQEVELTNSRCGELGSQLAAEIQAKEYLDLELHKADGLISGYTAERQQMENQIQTLEEQRENLIIQLDTTRLRLQELEQSVTDSGQEDTNPPQGLNRDRSRQGLEGCSVLSQNSRTGSSLSTYSFVFLPISVFIGAFFLRRWWLQNN